MAGVNGEGLRYYPMAENGTRGFDLATPMKAYQDHQKDLQAQKLAEQAMALRQQGQSEDMRRGQVADQQRAIGMQRDEAHTNHRDALYDKQEERRQGEVLFNRQKLTKAEHERLIHDLYFPPGEPGTPEYVARQEYAAAALQRAGYRPPEPILEDAPTAPGPAAAPGGPAPSAVSRKPMAPQDAALSGELDKIDATYSKGLGVAPGLSGMPYAQAKAAADASGALGVKQVGKDLWLPISKEESAAANASNDAAPGYIPGRSAVAKSNAMLDPGDPYNQLVK